MTRLPIPRPALLARRPLLQLMLAGALPMPWARSAEPERGEGNPAYSSRDPRLSDSDRVFMRSVSGLLIRMRQAGEMGGEQARQAELRRFSQKLSRQSDALFTGLRRLSEQTRTPVPLDMSDQAAQQLRALEPRRKEAFDAPFMALLADWMAEELNVLGDATERSENERVLQWARDALRTRLALSRELERLRKA